MNLSRILILAAFFWVVNFIEAQNPVVVKQSKVVQSIDGKAFYLHLVEQGQTLYSIAKAYNVDVESIRQYNNIQGDKVITGQKIKIPKTVETGSATNPNAASMSGADGQQDKSKNYFEYQARSKESLFLIALQYRVSIDDIYALNPGIEDQVKSEQIIKIPTNKNNANYITHRVKSSLTINRLAKDYKITVDQIREINPYIAKNLEPGLTVRIPLSKIEEHELAFSDTLTELKTETDAEPAKDLSGKELCFSLLEKGEIKVALLLPFYFSEIDTLKNIVANPSSPSVNTANPKSFNFIQFYEGFMMALDSLKKVGLNVKVYVFNVEDNVASSQQVINKPELKNMDIIIGPVHARSFAVVAEFARQNKIYIVNPFSTREEILNENPFVFKVKPSAKSQFPSLVSYLNNGYRHAQIFIAHEGTTQNYDQIEDLKAEMKRELAVREFPLTDFYTEIIYKRDSIDLLKRKASPGRENVIVLFSENKAFLLEFMRKLNDLKSEFQITVIGLPNWRKIEGLEPAHLSNLNARILAEDNADYSLPVVRNFVRRYRENYKTEPHKYAFEGYDVGIYFMSACMKYGSHFSECISYFDMDLINSGYDFEAEPGQGFENNYWKVLKIDNSGFIDDSDKLPTYDFSKPPSKYYKYQD
jgi:LysM repeat protein